MRIVPAILLLGVAGAAWWLYTPDKPRGPLEAAYAPPPSQFIEAAGIRLHVRDTGPRDAPAVILLHGLGSSLQTWDAWAGTLSASFRVVRYDLPGFGLTGADPTGDYTETRAVAVLAALMDALAIPRASVVGNSMGGKLAWEFAAYHPDRVEKLVLVSPDGFASPGFDYGKPAEIPFVARLLPYVMPEFLLRMNLAPAYGDEKRLTAPVLRRYWDMMRAPGVRTALLARLEQVRLIRPEPLLHRVQAPTLLVWGEQDRLIPFSNAQDYLREMKDARLVSFPGLGHVPQEEAPAESLPPVLAFLRP
jgi:pimeloyl-ACP methyl ester carboxylesterase